MTKGKIDLGEDRYFRFLQDFKLETKLPNGAEVWSCVADNGFGGRGNEQSERMLLFVSDNFLGFEGEKETLVEFRGASLIALSGSMELELLEDMFYNEEIITKFMKITGKHTPLDIV